MANALEVLRSRNTAIDSLCKEYAVSRLRVFGSAAKEGWDPATSDFDFVVEFGAVPSGMHPFDQYLGFKQELEGALGRSVDLVELGAVKNPFFLRDLERTALDLYAA